MSSRPSSVASEITRMAQSAERRVLARSVLLLRVTYDRALCRGRTSTTTTTSQWAFSWQCTGPSRFSRLKHWGKPGQCPICTQVVPQELIVEHWGNHFNMRQCGDCEAMVWIPRWEQHERIHARREHRCTRCNQAFASQDSLRKHMRRMHGSIKAKCACGTVVLETDMHAHMKSCPAHDLRLKYFWDVFPTVDEDTGELDYTQLVARPFTAAEYIIPHGCSVC